MDVESLNKYILQVLLLGVFLFSMPVVVAGPSGSGLEGVEPPALEAGVEPIPEPSKAGHTEEEENEVPQVNNGNKDTLPNTFSQKIKVCGPDGGECSNISLFLLVFYAVALIVGRIFWVVEPNNKYLKAHADRIDYRLKLESDPDPNVPVAGGIKIIREYLDETRKSLKMSIREKAMAFTGIQMAAWRSLHEAERLATDFYSSDVVRDQAKLILDKLRETQSQTSILESELLKGLEGTKDQTSQILDKLRELLNKISKSEGEQQNDAEGTRNQTSQVLEELRELLSKTSNSEGEQQKGCVGEKDLRPLVKEAKAVIHRDEDEQFEALADAQNKALWLVLTAALILFGLSWIFPEARILFLAGAAGGLLARLRKVVKARSLPFDYGLSWTVLFLTPLVGALTGWAGTLLFKLLQDWKLIGEFVGISIMDPTYATLMVALVFGYSATLFEKFVEQLEESISKK